MLFGDLEDLNSKVHKMLEAKYSIHGGLLLWEAAYCKGLVRILSAAH